MRLIRLGSRVANLLGTGRKARKAETD